MGRDMQQYVAGCILYPQTDHKSRKPIGLLEPLLIAKGLWQRSGIDIITHLPVTRNGHVCGGTFVNYMTKGAHWRAYRKTMDMPLVGHIFINDILHLC